MGWALWEMPAPGAAEADPRFTRAVITPRMTEFAPSRVRSSGMTVSFEIGHRQRKEHGVDIRRPYSSAGFAVHNSIASGVRSSGS